MSRIFFGLGLLRDKFYKWAADDYGLKEVFFWPKEIDVWVRYSKILNEIKKFNRKIFVLDVGCGEVGVARFLKYSGDIERCNVVLLDIRKKHVKNVKLGLPVVGDGCALPFKDNSFDVVVSVDSVEHIPQKNRANYLSELKRVSKNKVLLHFPAESPAEGFEGKKSDMKFQEEFIKRFGKPELNTAEHINCGHPTLKEIRGMFPNGIVQGVQNTRVWLKYMMFSRKSIVGFFTGLLYLLKWKKEEGRLPFHGCFFRWSKTKSKK